MRDNERKRAQRSRLDQLGRDYFALSAVGNEARRLALEIEIWELVFDLFGKQTASGTEVALRDATGTLWEKDWRKFDPNKGSLSSFMEYRLQKRAKDSQFQDEGVRKVKTADLDTQKQIEKRINHNISLDTPLNPGEDGTQTLSKVLPDVSPEPTTDDPLDEIWLNDLAYLGMLLILELPTRLRGKANNPIRQNYFRMFFTDGVVAYLHQEQTLEVFLQHERDLFHAMKLTFLDYFMCHPCRTVKEIVSCDLKPYGELVDNRPMERPKQPLPNDVYLAYLERVEQYRATAPAVTQQRQEYIKYMREGKESLC